VNAEDHRHVAEWIERSADAGAGSAGAGGAEAGGARTGRAGVGGAWETAGRARKVRIQ
jgi:hypothetical protein